MHTCRAYPKGSETGELMGLNHQNLTGSFMVAEPVLSFLLAVPYSRIKQILSSNTYKRVVLFRIWDNQETQIRNGLNGLN